MVLEGQMGRLAADSPPAVPFPLVHTPEEASLDTVVVPVPVPDIQEHRILDLEAVLLAVHIPAEAAQNKAQAVRRTVEEVRYIPAVLTLDTVGLQAAQDTEAVDNLEGVAQDTGAADILEAADQDTEVADIQQGADQDTEAVDTQEAVAQDTEAADILQAAALEPAAADKRDEALRLVRLR
jgi:hypothetical protein